MTETQGTMYTDIIDPEKRIAQLAYSWGLARTDLNKLTAELRNAVLATAKFSAGDLVEVWARKTNSYNAPHEWREAKVSFVLAREGSSAVHYSVRFRLKSGGFGHKVHTVNSLDQIRDSTAKP
jgi:hypothetical protein